MIFTTIDTEIKEYFDTNGFQNIDIDKLALDSLAPG